MSILDRLRRLLIYSPQQQSEPFTLTESPDEKTSGESENDQVQGSKSEKDHNPEDTQKRDRPHFRRPRRIGTGAGSGQGPALFGDEAGPQAQNAGSGRGSEDGSKEGGDGQRYVTGQVEVDRGIAADIFHVSKNQEIIIRDFQIGTEQPVRAFLLYVEGLTDKTLIDLAVLQPLMILARLKASSSTPICDLVKNSLLPGNQVEEKRTWGEVVDGATYGSVVLFVDGCPHAFAIEAKGWEHRGVDKPSVETVIRGPKEAFTETMRVNTALIRRLLRSPDLISELVTIGRQNRANCTIMYMENITNPALVREVKKRVENIEADLVNDSGMLEQFVEDYPLSPIPQTIVTERPDRVVAMLTEGRVAMVVDGSPFVLVVPATFFSHLQTAEDYYIRTSFGDWLRVIRVAAMFVALLLPGLYLAITRFHSEMIPTDLLLSIAGAREQVPFPTIVEVLLMEAAFELIQEAGIRVPSVIGPTLGIIGALILGQAAVAASIVSPILIIVVAVTGISSFAIPDYSITFAFRIGRFLYIFIGALFGFFGIAVTMLMQLILMSSLKSFGVPYMSPVGPRTRRSRDIILRGPLWTLERRPDDLNTKNVESQPQVSRQWLEGQDKNEA